MGTKLKLYIATPEQAKRNERIGRLLPPPGQPIAAAGAPLTERTPLLAHEVDEWGMVGRCPVPRISFPIEGLTFLFSAATFASGVAVAASDSASSRQIEGGSLATIGSAITASAAAVRLMNMCSDAWRSPDSDEENQYFARASRSGGCCCNEVFGSFASAIIVGANVAMLGDSMSGEKQAMVGVSIGIALTLLLLFVGKLVDLIYHTCYKG